jgi:protein phosphatase
LDVPNGRPVATLDSITPFDPFVPHQPTVFGLTDVGKTRTRNEDSWASAGNGVAVVADGMGGHPGGDVASRIAADTTARILGEELARTVGPTEGRPERLSAAMHRSVLSAHEAIRARGEAEVELDGMGTTLTAIVVDAESDTFVLGNVGDSRGYRFRGGELTRLTKDDTWVQERIDARQLTHEQARRHPFAHLLTQCLGLEDAPKARITHGSVEPGDVYLLCSDGLVGMIPEAEIVRILEDGLHTPSPAARASTLAAMIDAANEAGGYDNITAVLVTIA